ncbi:MAG: DNA-directed RNA polymerase subunit omega [Lentimicrobiaceae bacterium]|nr:DNA-directed RNA polymerase subunit omega [Lentimicrobiaceae bacterium]
MDYKKTRTSNMSITRNLNDFDKETDNIYETLVILSKRANQIASEIKEELSEKIQEFVVPTNELSDEIIENKEQVDLVRYYEQLPKPTLLATQEFLNGQVYYRAAEENQGYKDEF